MKKLRNTLAERRIARWERRAWLVCAERGRLFVMAFAGKDFKDTVVGVQHYCARRPYRGRGVPARGCWTRRRTDHQELQRAVCRVGRAAEWASLSVKGAMSMRHLNLRRWHEEVYYRFQLAYGCLCRRCGNGDEQLVPAMIPGEVLVRAAVDG